ncbi:hypothetical protein PR048_013119 [Dryococelus australis]|uniref:CCHC-type domain-containing protein n=1 Tax=Dryococelus australis TaxID=614101 RepID=A0ABQ9HR82_9NEOP|nr:hypothetical protein PR048_013119 [Dryococelus australis]
MASNKIREKQISWFPGIKKLQGTDNYSSWKFGMEMYLAAEDLWPSVTGAETDKNKDQKAKSKICLMIDESLIHKTNTHPESGKITSSSALITKGRKDGSVTITCYKCNKKGHKANTCKNNIICFNCNRRRQKSNECYEKKSPIFKKGNATREIIPTTLIAAMSSVTTGIGD